MEDCKKRLAIMRYVIANLFVYLENIIALYRQYMAIIQEYLMISRRCRLCRSSRRNGLASDRADPDNASRCLANRTDVLRGS